MIGMNGSGVSLTIYIDAQTNHRRAAFASLFNHITNIHVHPVITKKNTGAAEEADDSITKAPSGKISAKVSLLYRE